MSRRRSAGFTLLELTVSLAIAGLALASLTHLVQDTAGLETRPTGRLRASEETQALFDLLEELLAAVPLPLTAEAARLVPGSSRPSVSGTAHEITIASRGPRVLGLNEPEAFTFAFEDAGGAPGRIVLRWGADAASAEVEVVVADVQTFTLRYAEAHGSDAPAWRDLWSVSTTPPAIVEATVIEARTGRRHSRLVPVRSSLPPICVVQPLLSGCPRWN